MKELKWLYAFARLNKIACEKSLQRMAKNYLVIGDNIIEKQLLVRAKDIGSRFFHAAAEVNQLQQQIISFYADNFTGGNVEQAKLIIEHKDDYIRSEEVAKISFYLGLLSLAIPLNIFLIWSKDPASVNPNVYPDIGNWTNIDFIFRLFFFVFLIILGTASCVQILRAYKINYIYIFEIQPLNQMTHYQIYTFGLLLLLVLNVFMLL